MKTIKCEHCEKETIVFSHRYVDNLSIVLDLLGDLRNETHEFKDLHTILERWSDIVTAGIASLAGWATLIRQDKINTGPMKLVDVVYRTMGDIDAVTLDKALDLVARWAHGELDRMAQEPERSDSDVTDEN